MFVLPQSEIDQIRSELKLIEVMKKETAKKLELLRETLLSADFHQNTLVIANGSYARHESSSESDLDFYVLCTDEDVRIAAQSKLQSIQSELIEIAGKAPEPEALLATRILYPA